MTAMNKRNSQATNGASIPDAIQETSERPSTERTASEPNMSSNAHRSATEGFSSQSHSSPTGNASAGAKANGRQTPPSPSRLQHRGSGTPYSASTQPQNLDAVAEIVVRTARSASTSGPGTGARPIETSRSAPNFRQDYSKRGPEEFTTELRDSARRVIDDTGGVPPKLKVLTDPASAKPGSSQSPRSAIDPRTSNSQFRRLAPAVPEKLRPRRNTTTTVNQIGNPVVNPSTFEYSIRKSSVSIDSRCSSWSSRCSRRRSYPD